MVPEVSTGLTLSDSSHVHQTENRITTSRQEKNIAFRAAAAGVERSSPDSSPLSICVYVTNAHLQSQRFR